MTSVHVALDDERAGLGAARRMSSASGGAERQRLLAEDERTPSVQAAEHLLAVEVRPRGEEDAVELVPADHRAVVGVGRLTAVPRRPVVRATSVRTSAQATNATSSRRRLRGRGGPRSAAANDPEPERRLSRRGHECASSSRTGSRSGRSVSPSARKGTSSRTRAWACPVPLPRRSGRRRSTACAAITSSMATSASPSATISARRRAESGAIVIAVLDPLGVSGRDQLVRDGLGEEARLGGQALGGDAVLAQRVLGQTLPRREPVREPGERPLQELEQPLRRGRERGGERDAQEVERRGQREDLEVGDRDDSVLVLDDSGFSCEALSSISELAARERERVPQRPVQLGKAAEGERVLEVPRRARLPERASLEKRRRRDRDSARPGYGRTSAMAGWSRVRLAAKASRSSAPATSIASSRRSVSAIASAAMPVENAFELSERERFLRLELDLPRRARVRGRPSPEGRPGRVSRAAGRGDARRR